jgi:hypothetical protein
MSTSRLELDVERELEAANQFVARVLRQAHQAAQARDEPGDEHAILEVAELFADELAAGDPAFDGIAFLAAAINSAP